MHMFRVSDTQWAFVDEGDERRVFHHRWRVTQNGYVGRDWLPDEETDGLGLCYLANFLMQPPHRLLVDHRDGDRFNNLRGNLRITTWGGNAANRRKQEGTSSHYKGLKREGRRWRATITRDHVDRVLGTFERQEDAARAYDEAARALFGEFACVNFPHPGERAAAGGTIRPVTS